jgi:hypothetical protein
MRNPFRRRPPVPPLSPEQVAKAAGLLPVREHALTPLEQQRAAFRASLVPATAENVAAALAPTWLESEEMRARERADREAREQREAERLRSTRIRYEIDLTAEQWLLLVKHGYEPLRNGVCELEGVEIDGHEPSDLDPFGGCMHCGRQDIYGTGEDGRPIRFDDDPEGAAFVACPTCGQPMRTCGDPAEGDGCGLDRCYQCQPAGTQPCDHK